MADYLHFGTNDSEDRKSCENEKQRMRRNAKLSNEDHSILDILEKQYNARENAIQAKNLIDELPTKIEQEEHELRHSKSDVLEIREQVEKRNSERKPFFVPSTVFSANKEKVLSELENELQRRTAIVQQHEEMIEKYTASIEKQKAVIQEASEINRSQLYEIVVNKGGPAENLKNVMAELLSEGKIACKAYNISLDEFPAKRNDFPFFIWRVLPLCISDLHMCYMPTDMGIIVFDKTGVYIGTFDFAYISYSLNNNNSVVIELLDISIHFEVRDAEAGHRVEKAIDMYRNRTGFVDIRLSVIELLDNCTSAKNNCNEMKALLKAKHG